MGYIARHMPLGAVVAKRIADEYAIPQGYLLKVLQQLVRSQILDSVRGPQGGFVLARPAQEISVLDIIEAIEGAFITDSGELLQKNGHYFQGLKEVLFQASRDAARILRLTTLADIIAPRSDMVISPTMASPSQTPFTTANLSPEPIS